MRCEICLQNYRPRNSASTGHLNRKLSIGTQVKTDDTRSFRDLNQVEFMDVDQIAIKKKKRKTSIDQTVDEGTKLLDSWETSRRGRLPFRKNFLDLPTEIRLMIYQYSVTYQSLGYYHTEVVPNYALLQTCRFVNYEGIAEIFGSMHITVGVEANSISVGRGTQFAYCSFFNEQRPPSFVEKLLSNTRFVKLVIGFPKAPTRSIESNMSDWPGWMMDNIDDLCWHTLETLTYTCHLLRQSRHLKELTIEVQPFYPHCSTYAARSDWRTFTEGVSTVVSSLYGVAHAHVMWRHFQNTCALANDHGPKTATWRRFSPPYWVKCCGHFEAVSDVWSPKFRSSNQRFESDRVPRMPLPPWCGIMPRQYVPANISGGMEGSDSMQIVSDIRRLCLRLVSTHPTCSEPRVSEYRQFIVDLARGLARNNKHHEGPKHGNRGRFFDVQLSHPLCDGSNSSFANGLSKTRKGYVLRDEVKMRKGMKTCWWCIKTSGIILHEDAQDVMKKWEERIGEFEDDSDTEQGCGA